ncbi:hypothetical protein GCM10009765_41490 [Fodinicola feengrottensis]|uniref:ABC transporter domain-containing protein n=2 Tax=Fodinicola feengrottensis TaxID=435914 RepID=A0ABP4TGD8_9ACTN
MAADPVVSVDAVSKVFATRAGPVHALRDVSFSVPRGHTLGLVGESGSGKSTIARLVLGLERPTTGAVRFESVDLSAAGRAARKRMRRRMQMVFQDPYSSLLPHLTVLSNVVEPLRLHGIGTVAQRRERATQMLVRVGIGAASAGFYPRQFSGGQQQRIAIARALVLEPEFLVCDEPTSSLDVSVQAQILGLLQGLQRDLGLTCLFVSHNLAVIERMATEVVVMCGGRVVESASTEELFAHPAHPYTRRLLAAVLPLEGDAPPLPADDWDPASLDDDEREVVRISPGHYLRA